MMRRVLTWLLRRHIRDLVERPISSRSGDMDRSWQSTPLETQRDDKGLCLRSRVDIAEHYESRDRIEVWQITGHPLVRVHYVISRGRRSDLTIGGFTVGPDDADHLAALIAAAARAARDAAAV